MGHQKVTISSVGDISFAGGFAEHPELFHSWLDGDIREFLDADVRIANMEYVCLPEKKSWPGGLCLAEPVESLEAFKYAGFNVVTLGNNHILDFERETGMLATMRFLDCAGIKYCGAGRNIEEARKPAVIETGNKKVAIFSRLHDYSFVDVTPITATEDSPGVALLELNEIEESIKRYKVKGNIDVVVLCLHWGMQNLHDHSRRVHELGKELIRCGVDLILGSHSHVIQGLAKYDGKFCFYGQGNFYFYPYPLEGQPNGVLYGPEAIRHRTATASRFSYIEGTWSSEVIATVLRHDDRVVTLQRDLSRQLLKKIYGCWARFRPVVFQITWRHEIIKSYMNNILKVVKSRSFSRFIRLVTFGFLRLIIRMFRPITLG